MNDAVESDRDTKHLIFLVDGTWASPIDGRLDNQTNIFRMNLLINTLDDDNKHQIVFYVPGVGTRGFFNKHFGGIFGQDVDYIIKELYLNICSNYWDNDKLYLFGYSRGAVICRAIAGIISQFGILRAQHIHNIPRLWDAFVSQRNDPGEIEDIRSLTRHDERIEFLGLFDAVLGRNYKRDSLFNELRIDNTALESCVSNAVHILSIDDNRRRFWPVVWPKCAPGQFMKQIWMPGVHSDIGGNGQCKALSDIALLTMADVLDERTDLSLDNDVFEDIAAGFEQNREFSITNERGNRLMRLLAHRHRRIGRHATSHEEIHPVTAMLTGRSIKIREAPGCYDPSAKFFQTPLEEHLTERQELYRQATANIPFA